MDHGTEYHPYPDAGTVVKAEYLERLIAKFVDFLVMGALFVIPGFIGPLAGTTYILISDGFRGGQSLGKKIADLKVVSAEDSSPCDFKRSIIRNSPFGLLVAFFYLVGWIPYLGVVLQVAAFLAVFATEISLMLTDERGARFGDRVASTLVVARDNGAG